MFISKGIVRYTFLILIVITILIGPYSSQKAEGISFVDYKAPIYQIPISKDTQYDIWKLCEKNSLSYELVLAIFHVEEIKTNKIDNLKAEIKKVAYIRDYWANQGYSDENVFNLMLLSRQRGIEGCITFIKDNDNYEKDKYVQKVTEYKYFLEQSLDTLPVNN